MAISAARSAGAAAEAWAAGSADWRAAAIAMLSVRVIQGFIYWGGGSRSCFRAPNRPFFVLSPCLGRPASISQVKVRRRPAFRQRQTSRIGKCSGRRDRAIVQGFGLAPVGKTQRRKIRPIAGVGYAPSDIEKRSQSAGSHRARLGQGNTKDSTPATRPGLKRTF